MSEVTPNAKGRARIYACGGAAINIVSLIGTLQINPDLMADFDIVQIDTSKSNLTTRSTNVENYLLPKLVNVDGGGKDRTENIALIEEHIKPILKAHAPGEINIVLSSGSGSSGSVAATKLTNELLARGEAVIVLLIGTTASRKEALNTIETLKNYEQIAKARNTPVVLHYLQNTPQLRREVVNQRMLSAISYLAILFSRRNAGMDKMDLRNWLHFTKPEISKGLKAQLYSLSILVREFGENDEETFVSDLGLLGNILSVATLARTGGVTELPDEFMPEYHTEGFVPELKDSKSFDNKSVNYLITDGLVETFVSGLREYARRDRPQVAASSLLDDEDDAGGVNF